MSYEMIIDQCNKAIEEVKHIKTVFDRRIEYCLGVLHMLDAIVYGQPRSKLIIYQQDLRLQIELCADRTYKKLMDNNNAVSPVWGVLLMVAICTILAALVVWMTSDMVTSKTAVMTFNSIIGR